MARPRLPVEQLTRAAVYKREQRRRKAAGLPSFREDTQGVIARRKLITTYWKQPGFKQALERVEKALAQAEEHSGRLAEMLDLAAYVGAANPAANDAYLRGEDVKRPPDLAQRQCERLANLGGRISNFNERLCQIAAVAERLR